MDQPIMIFELTEEGAEEISSSPDDPHVHDYEELLIGLEGSLEHFIDFKSEKIHAPYVSFVSKGKVHRVIPRLENGKCRVWVIRFRSEFIAETIFQLYTLFHDQANLSLDEGPCFDRLVVLSKMMHQELQQENPDYGIARHLLSALLTMVEAEQRKLQPVNENQHIHSTTFRNFLTILEENFRRPEGVEFYAEKLFMSSRNLNLICQKILQQSISEIIETRKLTEAKNLLASTDKTIAEIAFELGYNEKSYFSNVFKKKSGQTPSEFRDQMKKLV